MSLASAAIPRHARPKARSKREVTTKDLYELMKEIKLASEQRDEKINKLVTDMAILRTQHAAFWKAIMVLGSVISAIAAGIGWVATTFLGKK